MANEILEFNNLSEEERKVALKILEQYGDTGNSTLFDNMAYSDFEEIPVDIVTFLHDRKYLGNGLYDPEGRFTLFPYWEEKLKDIFPDNLTTKYNTMILTGAIGLGKAQPMDSLVLTQDGYKKMRDLTLVDKVYGNDGKLHNILGIFPQGTKKICRVEFNDGTSTLCCDEHLWTVYNTKSHKWTTIETKQLMDGSRNIKHALGHRYKIPVTEPINFDKKELAIDPYILGVLIGDGSLRNASIKFTSADDEIVENVKRRLPCDLVVRANDKKYGFSICKKINTAKYSPEHHASIPTKNPYYESICNYGLDVISPQKHIPSDYLHSSIEDRIDLLQGLMDTDGYISKDGTIVEFSTTSEQLRDDVIYLVQSLGGICRIRVKHPFYYNKKTREKVHCRVCYNIGIKLPKAICPFKLSRKKERINEKALSPSRYISNIEYVGEDECQCIYVNSKDHLYLTNDFIVTHNTLVAVICLLYLLYRLLCLKDPYLYYGMQPIDKISISLMNITIENAKGVALDKMNQLILSSSWFMDHGKMTGTSNLMFVPDKHIELIVASSNNQVIGRAIFGNFSDEVNWGLTTDTEKLKKKYKQLVSQIDARMKSRYMRQRGDNTYLPTLNIIASSKNSEQSFLEDYIETKKKTENSKTLIVDEPQWVVDSRKDSKEKFYVAMGNKFLANELLPKKCSKALLDEYTARGYTLLAVPIGYWDNFAENIDGALMDIAGKATAATLKYISGVRWNEVKTTSYKNPFTKEIITVGNAKDDLTQYSDFFDLGRVSNDLKAKPMYIHLDMSKSGDKTGIAGVYVIGKKPKIDGEDSSRELFYRVAFHVSIAAPKGYEISFDKHRIFLRWLRENGFNIVGVSSDTYQSAPVLQQLSAEGFNTSIISVDRLDSETKQCLPYAYFKSTLYDRRLEVYSECDFLTEEVLGLERQSDGHINHPDGGTKGSKDAIDSVVGSLYNASKNAEEFAYDYGESIELSLGVSESKGNLTVEQINEEFEKALAETNDPMERFRTDINKNNNKNNTNSKPANFGFGVAQNVQPMFGGDGIFVW